MYRLVGGWVGGWVDGRRTSTRAVLCVSSSMAMGMRITRWGLAKEAFTVNLSVSLILSEAGFFLRIWVGWVGGWVGGLVWRLSISPCPTPHPIPKTNGKK